MIRAQPVLLSARRWQGRAHLSTKAGKKKRPAPAVPPASAPKPAESPAAAEKAGKPAPTSTSALSALARQALLEKRHAALNPSPAAPAPQLHADPQICAALQALVAANREARVPELQTDLTLKALIAGKF
jgi:hypothetical protein